jgi:hypothetical protein
MRFGNLEVRPLGGGLGCLFTVLFSVVASVVLTLLVNLLLRLHPGGRRARGAPQTRRPATVHRLLLGAVLTAQMESLCRRGPTSQTEFHRAEESADADSA